MENKQPEDDLFDRLNVSRQSELGWRGVQPAPPKLLKEGFAWGWPGLSLQRVLWRPVCSSSPGARWTQGQSPETEADKPCLHPPDSCRAFPSLGWMPAVSAGHPRPILDIWSGKMLTEQFALSACLRLKDFLGRCHEALYSGILFPAFSGSLWQSRKRGKSRLCGRQWPSACQKGPECMASTWIPTSSFCFIPSRLLF